MYTLDCPYYHREFPTIDELVDDVIQTGMDPNYNILYKGVDTGESLTNYISELSQED